MTIKRFLQLFIFYFLSIIIAIPLANLLKIEKTWLHYLMISFIGYLILTLPLTIMTIQKEKKENR